MAVKKYACLSGTRKYSFAGRKPLTHWGGCGLFVIVVYDVGERRVGKVLKRCRKYLHWVQNSVLEGELTASQLEKLKIELGRIIDPDEDSVIIYRFRSMRYADREIMGLKKGGQEFIL